MFDSVNKFCSPLKIKWILLAVICPGSTLFLASQVLEITYWWWLQWRWCNVSVCVCVCKCACGHTCTCVWLEDPYFFPHLVNKWTFIVWFVQLPFEKCVWSAFWALYLGNLHALYSLLGPANLLWLSGTSQMKALESSNSWVLFILSLVIGFHFV